MSEELRGLVTEAIEKDLDENVQENVMEAYIIGEDTDTGEVTITTDSWSLAATKVRESLSYESFDDELVEKSFKGSNQVMREVGDNAIGYHGLQFASAEDYVKPPYDPECLKKLLALDPVHWRSVKTKVKDSVGRGYRLEPCVQIMPNDAIDTESYSESAITQKECDTIKSGIQKFLDRCNDFVGFEGVLEKAALDYEGIGYSAIEVIRDTSGTVCGLEHVPAERIRVLRERNGFVELVDSMGKVVFYQMFGHKLLSKTRDIDGEPQYYDPDLDGPVTNTEWNLIDKDQGIRMNVSEVTPDVLSRAANEIVFKANGHPASVYYGVPDVIPAIPNLFANVEINDYQLQFFEHNTVPRYAILVKNASLSPDTLTLIKKFFKQSVRGKTHSTLVLPVKSVRGEVDIEFKALDTTDKEGSFMKARKENYQAIMTAHGIPPAILAIADSASLGSGKGTAQSDLYKSRIVTPLQRSWSADVNKIFRLGLGITCMRIAFSEWDLKDLKEEMEVLTGYNEVGALSVDEMRERASLGDPVKGGNYHVVQMSNGLFPLCQMTGEIIVSSNQSIAGPSDDSDLPHDEPPAESA